MRKQGILLLGVLMLCAVSFVHGADPFPNKQLIKIGVIIPLSGSYAATGEEVRNGFLLAKKNAKPSGYDFQFIFEDNQFSTQQSALIAQKLISINKVDAVISLWNGAEAVAPIAEQAGILHFSIRWNPDVAAQYHHTFTHETTYKEYAQAEIRLLKQMQARKIAIINVNSAGDSLGGNELERVARENGISVVAHEAFSAGTRDFRTMIAKIENAKPDVYMLFVLHPEDDILIHQIREVAPHANINGHLELLTDFKPVEGVPFVVQFDATDEFKKLYQDEYGKPLISRAPIAFDIFNMIWTAYNNLVPPYNYISVDGKLPPPPKPTTDAVIGQLMKIKDFPGAIGPLTIDKDRAVQSPTVLRIVKEGKLVPITIDQIKPLVH